MRELTKEQRIENARKQERSLIREYIEEAQEKLELPIEYEFIKVKGLNTVCVVTPKGDFPVTTVVKVRNCPADAYRTWKLSDREIEAIKGIKGQKWYCIFFTDGVKMFDMDCREISNNEISIDKDCDLEFQLEIHKIVDEYLKHKNVKRNS